jgi:hypothetical protein
MTGSCGVSSTPRPLDFIISVSGILDHPHARVMTIESVARGSAAEARFMTSHEAARLGLVHGNAHRCALPIAHP